MKLLFIYKYGILGGVATVLSQRFKALASLGVQCDLACLQNQGLTHANGGFPEQSQLWQGASLTKIATLLQEGYYTALINIDTPEVLAPLLESPINANSTIRLIYECHVPHPEGFLTLMPYESLLKAHADWILCPSKSSRQILLGLLPSFPPEKLSVFSNGLDTHHFSPVTESDPLWAARPKDPVLLWIGKFKQDPYHLKNWGGFLDLLQQARRQINPNITGWLLGGATATTETQASLARELFNRGLCSTPSPKKITALAPAIQWFPKVPYPALKQVYQAVGASGGAHIITSHHESFAMTAVESLLCGCPVISTPVGILPELAEWIQPPMLQVSTLNEAQTFHPSILSNILNQHSAKKLSEKDDATLRQQFSMETGAHQFIRLLSAAIP